MIKKQAKRVLKEIGGPFQRFFQKQACGGILLIFATLIAIAWANSPLAPGYEALWHSKLTINFGNWILSRDLLHWINDGLMAIFFLYVGSEIKREIMEGELSTAKKAFLPVSAALGGMLFPALLFISLNTGHDSIRGWGIPMATDIAFSLGVLMLLGKRVPLSLKIFLTTFAIVDDIGAVMVIALFYSSQIHWDLLLYAGGLLTLVLFSNYLGIKALGFYAIMGLLIWYFFLESGIHPTIAGVLIAFSIPSKRSHVKYRFIHRFKRTMNGICNLNLEYKPIPSNSDPEKTNSNETASQATGSPLSKLENKLNGFVTFFIMPLFALANAGIIFPEGLDLTGIENLTLDIAVSLYFGKIIGITFFTWLTVKLGLGALPENIRMVHILGLAILGGIGFTMSLFISNLAYFQADYLNHAKMGIFMASITAGVTGYYLLKRFLKRMPTIQ